MNPMPASTLISQATLVNEGQCYVADLLIKNGRIERIAPTISAQPSMQVIDAQGLHLLPGMIDDQVHFREPGLTHKGDMATESAAAVAGGITSFMEMPNVNPATTTAQALADKYQRAQGRAHANYAFYLGATNDNLEQIKALDVQAACGIKVFMGASTGNMLVDDPQVLESIFAHAPILVATHCEDTPMIQRNEALWRQRYGENVPMDQHGLIRSEHACYASSSFAVELARRQGTRLHVLHLTTAKELVLFSAGDHRTKQITAEVCVHHLLLNQQDYARKGTLIKCNPAIKTQQDQQALQQALAADVIDIVATDHAPHTWDEKQRPYFEAPSGLPLVQHALVGVLQLYHQGILSLADVVKKTSHAVADCYAVAQRGYIRQGYWADLVLVDLHQPTRATHDTALYKCKWTPFDGDSFNSSIVMTWVNGCIAYHAGQPVPDALGQPLQFER